MGRITTTTYDNRGWVATVDRPAGKRGHLLVHGDRAGVDRTQPRQAAADRPASYFYDKDDRLIAETDANSNTTTLRL